MDKYKLTRPKMLGGGYGSTTESCVVEAESPDTLPYGACIPSDKTPRPFVKAEKVEDDTPVSGWEEN